MTLKKALMLNVSLLVVLCCAFHTGSVFAISDDDTYQIAWDNPKMNMSSGSSQPGYANLFWSKGTVLPIKTRSGMSTLVTLPTGEKIADIMIGSSDLFDLDVEKGSQIMYITPSDGNTGSDTNMIVTGESGNVYTFYLRAYPVNSSEISYSQVDISLGNGGAVSSGAAPATSGRMGSVFKHYTFSVWFFCAPSRLSPFSWMTLFCPRTL